MIQEIESMFSVRNAPWHGLGVLVNEALNSHDAIRAAGLNWTVSSERIYSRGNEIAGYKANVRSSDKKTLGIVSDKYQIVQNHRAFEFTDSLIDEGVTYETAGSLADGRRIWLLAKLPKRYSVAEDNIESYLLFSNSHDGSTGIKAAITPIRVLCMNSLNLALKDAQRIWMAKHTGDVAAKMSEARRTLQLADVYMEKLKTECEGLEGIGLTDDKVYDLIKQLLPETAGASDLARKNNNTLRENLALRYFDAPDLSGKPRTALRFINAVSDFVTHTEPLRKTQSYRENMFKKTVDGHPLLDMAHQIVLSVA